MVGLGRFRRAAARLPEMFLADEPTVQYMKPGDVGYITFEEMVVDEAKGCFLYRGTQVYAIRAKHLMRIECREDGLHVWPPRHARYETLYNSYDGDEDYLPVAEVHTS